MSSHVPHSAFRPVPRTGVIFVTGEARKLGFDPANSDWCNLGQGQPETGALPGAPPREHTVPILVDDQEYAPVPGLMELREAIAAYYNRTFRKGMKSQYAPENICISGGGRVGLARAAAALGHINLGHFLPDYTAYEELLDVFKAFTAIPILLDAERGYSLPIEELRKEITGRGLGALLFSNPNNPTGKLIQGEELRTWIALSRECECALLIDEFYSHYIWGVRPHELPIESAARYIEDVEREEVVLFDGLTKNWRYPGWRICWTVGPKHVIEAVSSAGSFLDGGGSRPLQRAAIHLMTEAHVQQETMATHEAFIAKRNLLVSGLERLGVRFDGHPEGTFYAWGDVSGLPGALADGMGFFREALKHKVIVVPGEFFDINPGKRRHGRASRFRQHVRFSFGPSMEALEKAVERLDAMVGAFA